MIQDGVHVFSCSRFRSITQPFWRCTCGASCHVCSLSSCGAVRRPASFWGPRGQGSEDEHRIKEANERAKPLAKEITDAEITAAHAKSKLLDGNVAQVRALT